MPEKCASPWAARGGGQWKTLGIQRRVGGVDVFLVEALAQQGDGLAKALEVDNFPLAEEANHVVDIGIVAQAENIVVCDPRLLLGGQILGEVGDGIAFDADACGVPGRAGGGGGVDAGGVVDEVGHKSALLNLAVGELAGELVDDGADHLQVSQLFGTYRSNGNVPIYQI